MLVYWRVNKVSSDGSFQHTPRKMSILKLKIQVFEKENHVNHPPPLFGFNMWIFQGVELENDTISNRDPSSAPMFSFQGINFRAFQGFVPWLHPCRLVDTWDIAYQDALDNLDKTLTGNICRQYIYMYTYCNINIVFSLRIIGEQKCQTDHQNDVDKIRSYEICNGLRDTSKAVNVFHTMERC